MSIEASASNRRRNRGVGSIELLEGRTLLSGNLTITPTFDKSITKLSNAAAVETAIKAAITDLENKVTTNNPVNVKIDFKDMNTGLGASLTDQADVNYSTYLSFLKAEPNKSANDLTALATMPAGPNTGINGATQVLLTAADLDAIGDTADAAVALNGDAFNSIVSFNLSIINATRTNVDPNKYDLQTTAAHEIDEVLGIGGSGSTLYQPGDNPPADLPTDVGPLDFFRYHAKGVRSFTYDPNTSAYFSINGGKTNIVYFNQQNGNGGSDFGDWGNPQGTAEGNVPAQVQDAFGNPGIGPDSVASLGVSELTALDVIGYNLVPQTTAPHVTTNPLNQMVPVGQDVKFTAAATGTPTPTVQWLVETPGKTTFSPIPSATSTTLDIGPATPAENGNKYEAIFSNGSTATTTAATLTVTTVPVGGTISGVVFNDIDGNGAQGAGENDLSGFTINLLQSGKVIATTTSSATGYAFTGLATGTFTVEQVALASYNQTAPAGSTFTVTLTHAGQTDSGLDFGDQAKVVVGNGVFTAAATIGNPMLTGSSASFSNGVYTVNGTGRDIYGTTDQFEFDYANVTGNTEIVANVVTLSDTYTWAKAGVMIRASTAPDAAFADVVQTPDHGVAFQWRATTGGPTEYVDLPGYHVQQYVKLIRTGDSFAAYTLIAGTTGGKWLEIGTSQTINMGSNALAGLAVTSVSPTKLAEATFNHVTLKTTIAAEVLK